MIVGVDNGLDGGLCAISDFDGGVIDKIPMPTMQKSKKREVDARKINEWLISLHTPFTLAVEEPLAHAKSSQAVRSMALSFGKIVGMAEVKGYDLVRVSVHKWQKEILGNIPKGMSKKFAMKIAESMAPEENWLKNKRCRKPHDGMIDAYLIAKYILTKQQK
mgnify:CR=1 FL=1|tara:strand:+ start:674 stop:1159 length:486 start_codon:yes stop_codon:yes gene_type:complete